MSTMFKKLFGQGSGQGGGGGGPANSANSTGRTVDAIQKLGEVSNPPLGRHLCWAASNLPALLSARTECGVAAEGCTRKQTEELLIKRRSLLEKKIALELAKAKEYTKAQNKRGAWSVAHPFLIETCWCIALLTAALMAQNRRNVFLSGGLGPYATFLCSTKYFKHL